MTDLVIKQGKTSRIRVPNVRDADENLITDFTGYSARAQVRERVESATVLHEWASPTDITFEGSDVVLAVSAATSASWAWTLGRYDVELTGPGGEVATIAEGHIIVEREVTR